MSDERFADILRRLKEADDDYDQESAHVFADDLLCEALEIALGDDAAPILDAYHKVPKWYA